MSDFLGLPEHRETVEQLERRIARVAPPDDLIDRILAETAPTPVAALDERRARNRRTGWALGGLAAAAAAVAAIAIVTTGGDTAPASRAALQADGVSGEARIYEPESDAGRLVVQLDDVPAAPSDHHYEVWVLRRGSDEMEAVGTFAPSEPGAAELELRLPGAGDYVAVDVSVEENGGSAEHSGTSLVTGKFA